MLLLLAAGWAARHVTLLEVLSVGVSGVVVGVAVGRRVMDRRQKPRRRRYVRRHWDDTLR